MKYGIKKRVFNKGTKTEKVSLSLQKPMLDALKELSQQSGYTVPELVCEVLEQFLVQSVIDGDIKAPLGEEQTIQELATALSAALATKAS